MEVLLTENRAQNKIEYHQILLSYAVGNEVKRNADKLTGSRLGLKACHNKKSCACRSRLVACVLICQNFLAIFIA